MSKKRNRHLRRALELVIEFMKVNVPIEQKEVVDTMDSEYWVQLACTNKYPILTVTTQEPSTP